MRKIFILTVLSIVGMRAAWAQPLGKSSYEATLQVAAEKAAEKDYYNAAVKYEEAYEEKEDRALLPKLADLYYLMRDYTKAERTYARFLRRDTKNEFLAYRFNYGRVLKMNGKYEDALKELQLFVEGTQNDSLKTLAQAEITGAEMALSMPIGTKINIEHGGKEINTASSEYSAVLARGGNTMYIAALPAKEVIIVDEKTANEQYIKIFKAAKTDKGWGKPEPLDEKINRQGYHTAHPSFSTDGNRMYFTRIQLQGNVIKEGKIFYSVGGDGAWNAANEVAGINGNYVNRHPVVGELFGKEVLFFSSNMPGGYGGYDLYYATAKGEGVYADPVNLGPKINTLGDEETPFYLNGTLYFSSTGHPGLGGFDIFYTTWDGTTWSNPLNMGNGYNTSVDDSALALDAEGYNGFLVSNREGGRSLQGKTCCDDIYTFTIPKMSADLVVGLFDANKKPLTGGTIQLVEMPGNKPGKSNQQTSEKGNRFGFVLGLETPYRIVANREGYYPDSTTITTAGLKESKTFEHRFYLKPKPVPPPEPEYDTIAIEQAIVLENILYDLDDDRIKPEAEPDLQVVYELMTEYPDMVIELGSHTDNRASDTYNQNLSQRRAESARRWLIRKGIPRERIEVKGYGESQPKVITAKQAAANPFLKEGDVLSEDFINKLENEAQKEAAHAINRRTEFKIVKGPTSIIIKSTRLRKNTSTKPAPNKNASIAVKQDTLKIHEWSSLHGKTNLKGVPVMQFKERFVDFGKVKKGEKRYHKFEFTNHGDVDLKIALVSACDCTTAEWSRSAIKPGEKGFIEITFDSKDKDYAETIDIEVFLSNVDPASGNEIVERLQYKFDILK